MVLIVWSGPSPTAGDMGGTPRAAHLRLIHDETWLAVIDPGLVFVFGGLFWGFFLPVLGRDISNIHTTYENNVVVNNTGDGIAHEISMDALVTGNIGCFNGYAMQARSMVVQAKLNV